MASHRPKYGGTGRFASPVVDSARNTSSRLPTKSPLPTITTNVPTSTTSRLTKRRPSTGKGSESLSLNYRSPSVGGMRRLIGQELRRELEQPGLPTPARQASASPAKSRSQIAARMGSEPTRTPSLVSGSSASTNDSPRSTRLRRKTSNTGKQNVRTSPDSSSSQEGMDRPSSGYKDPYPDAVLGIAMPPVPSPYTRDHSDDIINLDQYVATYSHLTTADLPPPEPFYGSSSTPSTGYSPGPFSISSTPTSMSSASPGFNITSGYRTKQPSPIRSRPPTSRKLTEEAASSYDARGLPSVRESSSSSTSTLRGGDSGRSKDRTRFPPMPAPSPSPPPQKYTSSHHRRASSDNRLINDGSSAIPRKQVPPELAHLVDSSPQKGSISSSRPTRPSRDGAPEIGLQERSPIIQSNMVSLPATFHRRQSSSEGKRAVAPLTVDTRPRFGIPRTRTVSPSPSQSSALSPMTLSFPNRGFTPDTPSESEGFLRVRPTPPVESKPFSRFGFFSKKNKSEVIAAAALKEKKAKKGPVAGTGHEGYGRFAFRGRSGSTTSGSGNTSAGRSPSTDSAIGAMVPSSRKSSIGSKNGSDFEEFLAEREKPITIRGGQIARPVVERSQTEVIRVRNDTQNLRAMPASSDNLPTLDLPKRPVLLPSPMSDPPVSSSPMKRQATVVARKGEKKSLLEVSTQASRRTSRRSFLGGKALAALSRSETASVDDVSITNGSTSRQNSASSDIQEEAQDGPDRAPNGSQASLKPPSKWNFLQRARSPARKDSANTEPEQSLISRQMSHRSIAHYALADGSKIDADELEKIMQEAEETTPDDGSNSETEQIIRARSQGKAAIRHGNSILLPAPPRFVPAFVANARPASPKVTLKPGPTVQSPSVQSPPQGALNSPPASRINIVGQPRPSRLPQVGRIPRVVSKRDRERKLSDDSFSRPFQATQPSPALKNGPLPSLPGTVNPEFVKARLNGLSDLALAPAYQGIVSSPEEYSLSPFFTPPNDFRSFQRKNSEQSNTSSSSGYHNILTTTAVIPSRDAPPMEDEIWSEYDDILDMLSTKMPKTPRSPKTPMTGSSCGAPFQYAEFSPKDPDTILRPSTAPSDRAPDVRPSLPAIPTVSAFAQRIRLPSLHDSRIMSSLPSAGTPNSPFRMSEFVSGYGERNLSVVDPVTGRLSFPSPGRLSTSTNGRFSLPATIRPQSTQTKHARAASNTKSSSSGRDSRTMERAETAYMGFENLANLRFGALMTSKWLSFGRVLFSPAHTELTGRGEHRVLILDGLGKDWSFYVALNYPKATVYNLGSDPADGSERAASTASPIQSLPNHRHIHHPTLGAPFPFPKGFFTAVVFRFPIATTESAYKSAVFECKRVLQPGGYLEVSILDMDMMNMGSRARSALRGLKMKMQAEEENISLKPLSDTIQRLLHRRGFENLNRCLVGVPCAGPIPGSRDEGSEDPQSASVESSTGSGKGRIEEQLSSFGDLVQAQGQGSDEGMTKMVSRVGRWWYSRCYESLVLPDGDISKSIWADDALVRECDKRSTSLKLMVCYAQKPDCPVRRTISV